MLLDGYMEWLILLHKEYRAYDEAEVHITLEDVFKERNLLSEMDYDIALENFKIEYKCQWIGDRK